jgi:hypothetical protein
MMSARGTKCTAEKGELAAFIEHCGGAKSSHLIATFLRVYQAEWQ